LVSEIVPEDHLIGHIASPLLSEQLQNRIIKPMVDDRNLPFEYLIMSSDTFRQLFPRALSASLSADAYRGKLWVKSAFASPLGTSYVDYKVYTDNNIQFGLIYGFPEARYVIGFNVGDWMTPASGCARQDILNKLPLKFKFKYNLNVNSSIADIADAFLATRSMHNRVIGADFLR